MNELPAYADPNNYGNSPYFHTGRTCMIKGCKEPAGTAWGKLWCFKHNVERIQRINTQFEYIKEGIE